MHDDARGLEVVQSTDHVKGEFVVVTWYPVIATPFPVGAAQVRVIAPVPFVLPVVPSVAVPIVGAFGVAAGITALDAAETVVALAVPARYAAVEAYGVTVNV